MINWDINAGAPLRPEVAELLGRAFSTPAGNPSSIHQLGRRARARLDAAREQVAQTLGAKSPRELIFCGSGTEAASIAILGAWLGRRDSGRTRLVTSAIEHPCVLGAMTTLERLGAQVVRVAPGQDGRVDAARFLAEVDDRTALASLMAVNNETGVVQPAPEVGLACAQRGVLFHCDAVQAPGRIPCAIKDLPADLLSFSAHKLGAPPGSGLLYAKRGTPVHSPIAGHQEDGRRGGTPSVVFAEALALALTLAVREQSANATHLAAVRDSFEAALLRRFPSAQINGAGAPRSAGTANITFPGTDAEALLIALDQEGILVSTGAACASGSLSASHVLLAMGRTSAQAHGTLRFSMAPGVTHDEAMTVLAALERLVPACSDSLG